jgi:hypothetical protein
LTLAPPRGGAAPAALARPCRPSHDDRRGIGDADRDSADAGDAGDFLPCPLTDGTHDLTLTLYAPQSVGGALVSVTQFQFGIVGSDYDGGVFNDMPDADGGDDADDATTCCP